MGKLFQYVILPVLFAFSYFYGGAIIEEVKPVSANPSMIQSQIKTNGSIIAADGSLTEVGYMTTPIRAFNVESLTKWQQMRMKKWDYFDVFNDNIVVTFAISDIFYIGDIRLNIFDYTTRQYKTFKKNILPTNLPKLSPTSYRFTNESPEDNIFYQDSEFTLKVENIGSGVSPKYNARKVSITTNDINFEFTMGPHKDQEAMVGVIPLTAEKKNFFYTVKMPNMFAEGSLKIGEQSYEFTEKNANSFIDWARGVWNYHTYWVFARAQGFLDNGKRFSLNFVHGYGHNETMKATEDAFFIDTKLFKLKPIEPTFDDHNLMNPWTLKTYAESSGKHQECDVVFAPHFVDQKVINYFVAKNDFRVVYGQFSGWVSDEKGNKYNFENLNGYIEVFKAKW